MQFKDEVVLITGSARGIGKEIALAFANQGATVIISDINGESCEKTVAELKTAKLEADSFPCDVTNLSAVEEMMNKILDKYKRIDILINNAGITKDNLFLRMKEEDWDAVIKVNLKGTFNCCKAISKSMLKARKGKIISIASVIGILGNIGQANYAASKAGIIGLTKSLAREFASRNINVNAVAPGYIKTEMTDQLKEETRQEILKSVPLKRMGTPADVAGACLFLASKEAEYITGQTIRVDGGMAI
ncbi:MAG: 3-oxoacyl-[acyl-carrier-protein] reductase [Candidatus Omnitrophica bacterium]|nr:3-oxoacyl-[acyl-carrier-protein] reductase [Candidatus Omnitrophota bacterium]